MLTAYFRRLAGLIAIGFAVGGPAVADAPTARQAYDGMPDGEQDYAALVQLWDDFLYWQDPQSAGKEKSLVDVAGLETDVYPDYSAQAIAARLRELREFQGKLDDFSVSDWPRRQQVEFLAVRAKMDEEEFTLRVSKPWSRDPGFYVDRMLRLTFTELPVSGEALAEFERQLDAVPGLAAQGKSNLTEVAADYADLAIFNLSNSDGVGHGFPYRAAPPPGVLGWYEDLLERARGRQPELVAQIETARTAVASFRDWLIDNRSDMKGNAGVGKEAFDWYLKHVKLMPYTSDDIVTLGQRELDRLWSLYALERHRNRDLPEIRISGSAEEYQSRIDKTDAIIRRFLVDEEIITIPEYIGELSTNVPWIVRDGGPNFWEQVQYRDPTPDHLHAVIPGHRFDAVVERNNPHPIRGRIADGARVEGWAVYLEEAIMNAGLLDDKPRVRELIYLFGIFRAARMPADVWLQLNVMNAEQVADYWIERVPYLDRDVARVDAEIYLRRPPGYGLGYTTGMLQMQGLLAARKRQLGAAFRLKDFHDEFMAAGRLPLSLIRWEMTGSDEDIAAFWSREPLPAD
ncbi:MAG: DUF885 family protein [Woeseiaceae bacterium]|nr:DUF885 family protein [Woeseiaceae bacterium]